MLRNSTPRFVGRSVGLSVRRSVCPSVRHTLLFLFFVVFGLTTPAQMIKWPRIWPLPTRTRLGWSCKRPCSFFLQIERFLFSSSGLIGVIIFYLVILAVGLFAAWRNRKMRLQADQQVSAEDVILAKRNINLFVGIMTMTGWYHRQVHRLLK